MSTVIAWGADEGTGNIGSCYIASDSRFSNGKHWDNGQKIFALNENGIIGYVGDVLFPITILHQVIDLINREIIFKKNDSNKIKSECIFEYIKQSSKNYLSSLKNTTIIFILVQNKKFNLYEITFNPTNIIEVNLEVGIPKVYGSGKKDYQTSLNEIKYKKNKSYIEQKIKEEKLSRYIFQSLVNSIKTGKDNQTGGHIQLVGLYKNGKAQPFGIIQNGKRYLYGQELNTYIELSNICWRNIHFENIEPNSMKLKENAQVQPFFKFNKE